MFFEAEPPGDDDDLSAGLAVGLHVGAGSPGAVAAGDGIEVPVESPFVGEVFVLDEGEAGGDAVLRGEAADGDMHGLAGDEGLGAVGEAAELKLLQD